MSDRPDNYFTMFVGDYLRDTMHLTTRQHGAYQLLLMHYYGTGRPLPLHDEAIRMITRLQPVEWKSDRAAVMAYFTEEQDGWHQKRADKELTKAAIRYTKAVNAAAAKHDPSKRRARAKHPPEQDASSAQAGSEHNQPSPSPPVNQPTRADLRSGERAAARVKTAAPPASPASGWWDAFPAWQGFREKLTAGEWTWFSACRLDGSEFALLVPGQHSLDQVRERYGAKLNDHFGRHISIRYEPKIWDGKTLKVAA